MYPHWTMLFVVYIHAQLCYTSLKSYGNCQSLSLNWHTCKLTCESEIWQISLFKNKNLRIRIIRTMISIPADEEPSCGNAAVHTCIVIVVVIVVVVVVVVFVVVECYCCCYCSCSCIAVVVVECCCCCYCYCCCCCCYCYFILTYWYTVQYQCWIMIELMQE